jgi:hypothetical protein
LIVQAGDASAVVPLVEEYQPLRWLVDGATLWLGDPSDDEAARPYVPLPGAPPQAGRGLLRWSVMYARGRFWIDPCDPPVPCLDGIPLDVPATVDWPDRVLLSWVDLVGVSVSLDRHLPVPAETVPCPECGATNHPLPIAHGYPGSFTSELARRGLVAIGGCIPGPQRHRCGACDCTFEVEQDYLAPSIFAAYCDWRDETEPSAGAFVVKMAHSPEDIHILAPEILLGTSERCDLVLEGEAIAEVHARVVRARDGVVWVVPRSPSHATFVNGAGVERPARVEMADVIGIGRYRFQLSWRPRRRLR